MHSANKHLFTSELITHGFLHGIVSDKRQVLFRAIIYGTFYTKMGLVDFILFKSIYLPKY